MSLTDVILDNVENAWSVDYLEMLKKGLERNQKYTEKQKGFIYDAIDVKISELKENTKRRY